MNLRSNLPSRRAAFLLGALLATVVPDLRSATALPTLPEGHTATVNGAKLWYISEGQGEPLVIISGGPGVAHYLYPYFSALAANNQVIYLDSYGTGKSDRAASPGEYTLARHVDEIEGLRLALRLEKINLLGHSYGGMVAQAFALKYPGSVRRLILANTHHSAEMFQAGTDFANLAVKNHYPEVWAKLLDLRARRVSPLSKEWGEVYGQIPDSLFYNADFTNKVPLLKDVNSEVWYAMGGIDGDFALGGELAAFDPRERLKELPMPVLILAGRMDRVALPIYMEQFKVLIPRATFVMFEKSGHNVFQEENSRMIEVLREFLHAKNPASPAAEPAALAEKYTYVVVHGATGGGWSWKAVDRLLTAAGHLVYRPTLTGVGERVHLASPAIGLTTHIDDIVNLILFEDLHAVVLVGHSYGGMVATGVLDRIPERIKRVVFLDAALPEDGESFLALRGRADPKEIVLTPEDYATGFKRPDPGAAAQPIPRPVPHPIKTYTDPVSFRNPAAKQVPATAVLFLGKKEKVDEKENSLDAYHRLLWERAGARGWTRLTLISNHGAEKSRPKELAALLEQIPSTGKKPASEPQVP